MAQRPAFSERIDFILQLWFFVLAAGSILTFFLCRATYPKLFITLGVAAIVLRIIYYVKKMLSR